MSRMNGLTRDKLAPLVRPIAYLFFAPISIFAGVIAIGIMSVFGLIYVAMTWGITGTEAHLAALSILGMAFYMGIELTNEFADQFSNRFLQGDGILASVESIDPDESENESAPFEFIVVFIWVGGIVFVSVIGSLVLIETPLEAWAIPFALLLGVTEIVLASEEIPGPVLLVSIMPFLLIYTIAGITSSIKDLLPQRIFTHYIRQFRRGKSTII